LLPRGTQVMPKARLNETELMLLERLMDAAEEGIPVGFEFIAATDHLPTEAVLESVEHLLDLGIITCSHADGAAEDQLRPTEQGLVIYRSVVKKLRDRSA
jgi:hypothetical protein